MITCHDINRHMNGDRCPTSESLGECAAITTHHAEGSTAPFFTAHLYRWSAAANLTAKEVAQWFLDLGATDVTVSHLIHDPDNGIIGGVHEHDGVKPWDVSYLIPNNHDTANSHENPTFQSRVGPWLLECFGTAIAFDQIERNHRFLEESLELVQSLGCTVSEAHQLVDYVFERAVGKPDQEVGGVMVTLAALCLANAMDMHDDGEIELARIWTKVDQIREKQARKPKHSPLPGSSNPGEFK